MIIRCIIVDDEIPAIDELDYILSGIEDVEVVASARSASKAVQSIKRLEPDLVFLDIQMPGHSGFHVAREASVLGKPPLIIFATAYDQYAIRAFEEGAVDYVLKPFSETRIRKSLSRAREMISTKSRAMSREDFMLLMDGLDDMRHGITRISVEKGGRIILLDPGKIFFCKAEDRNILVSTRDDRFTGYGLKTLDELEERLKFHSFFRTHRTYLVNMAHVSEIIPWYNGRYVLVMHDNSSTEVPVSRTRARGLKEKLGLL